MWTPHGALGSLCCVATVAIALFQFASADAGEGTCSDPYVIAGLPATATNQLFGVGPATNDTISNYNWPSIYLLDSADFSFMLLGDSPDPRYITVETGVTESGQCAPSASRWDTELVAFAHAPYICGASSAVLFGATEDPWLPGLPKQALIANNDDSSVCGHPSSRIAFIAAPGQDYLIVVKGFNMEEAGPATIAINSTLATIAPTPAAAAAPLARSCLLLLPAELGQCRNPVAITGVLPGQSPSVWGAGASTCDVLTTSWFPSHNPDFTYRLLGRAKVASIRPLAPGAGEDRPFPCGMTSSPLTSLAGDVGMEREVELDTCVEGQAAWDTEIRAYLSYDDDSSACGGRRSRLSFTAAPGASYLIVVSGYGNSYRCGSAALTVAAYFPETSESSSEQSSEASAVSVARSRKLLAGA
ncbi:hypothetical protein QJQ45_014672 [Haematococcus lacustris]|nr:hypothetical protein QJQ45_014672 [Haematococcus lacustris]